MNYEKTGDELRDNLAALLEDLQGQMVQNEWDMLPAEPLHGFITAIAIGPRMIIPNDWLPRVFFNEMTLPEFTDEQQAKRFTHAILNVYEGVLQTIQNGSFAPYVSCTKENGKETEDLSLWCSGFLLGICLFDDEEWDVFHDTKLAEICLPIFFNSQTDRLPEMYTRKQLKQMETVKEESGDLIVSAVYDIQEYFSDGESQQPPIPEQRSEPKPHRNDACPCGSGKKFKKCCGGKQ